MFRLLFVSLLMGVVLADRVEFLRGLLEIVKADEDLSVRRFTQDDENTIAANYERVRNADDDVTWCTVVYDDKILIPGTTGTSYSGFLDLLKDDIRVYGYARFETGDEMSRRVRFAFITWIGSRVKPLKKARVSTDKAFVKELWTVYGKEILADELSEVTEENILKALIAASGASYGTGH